MTEVADNDWAAWFEYKLKERERERDLRNQNALLDVSLQVAIPFWIEFHRDTDPDRRVERARELAQVIASHGDDILYRSKRSEESARAFNALAEGIALMAYQPGGVRFMGVKWEVT